MSERTYIAIDLKSFYASVECIQREVDPMTACLVVADPSRTEKTICLAVSPALKSYGIPGRPRLFEVVQQVREINSLRKQKAPGHTFTGSTWDDRKLRTDPSLSLDYIVAPPRMGLYMETSTRIYQIYLKYVAPEDIHVYSIDEVFMDVTNYLKTYGLTPRQLAMKIILDVLHTTGITATAGIGTNLYLAKVAMDIEAKHIPADRNGVRIAQLNEMSYRRSLWMHRPLTDFWRVGRGIAKKLEANGMYTMGDVARCSLGKASELHNENLLYKLFGINAELLIDHAWGWEPCTIAQIKAYKPESNSLGSGQVLPCAYSFDKARLILREMVDLLSLDLVDKGLLTDQLVLTVGYDIDNRQYRGEISTDRYGRKIPKHAHGTQNLQKMTASTRQLTESAIALYDRIVDPSLLIRRMYICANHVLPETEVMKEAPMEQLNLFQDPASQEAEETALERERRMQEALLSIKRKYGKNAILKGMNLEEGATARERNGMTGGHKT